MDSPKQLIPRIEQGEYAWRYANKTFSTEAEVVKFIHDFWTNILSTEKLSDMSALRRIMNKSTLESLKEETVGLDRTVVSSNPNNDKKDFPYIVTVYSNSDIHPLSEKAVNFLKSRAIKGE